MPRLDYMVPAGAGNPQWANEERTKIDIDVMFPHLGTVERYTAAQHDPGWEHSEEIFSRAASGEFGPIDEYHPIVVVPETVSDRQFFQELAVRELITEQEALDAVSSGVIPSAFGQAITQLPAEQQFSARMLLMGATEFHRSHPFTMALGTLLGKSSAEIDDIFIEAKKR